MKTWEFTRARSYVRKLRLRTAEEFYEWCAGRLPGFPHKPDGIPSNPHQVYAKEWVNFPDWLDTNNIAPFLREWAPFEYAREFVHSLELASSSEWSRYASGEIPALGTRPAWLPSNPNLAYRYAGWAGIRDWLGTGDKVAPRASTMRPFAEARVFARSLGLQTRGEWRDYVAGIRRDLPPKPMDIPSNPQARYRTEGWVTFADFLGGNKVAWHQVVWREFNAAREFARDLGVANMLEWRSWAKSGLKPDDIPANPEKAYSEQWHGWGDWLGKQAPMRRRTPGRAEQETIRRKKPAGEPRFPPILHSSRVTRKPAQYT